MNNGDCNVCVFFKVYPLCILIILLVFYAYVGDFALCTFVASMKIHGAEIRN